MKRLRLTSCIAMWSLIAGTPARCATFEEIVLPDSATQILGRVTSGNLQSLKHNDGDLYEFSYWFDPDWTIRVGTIKLTGHATMLVPSSLTCLLRVRQVHFGLANLNVYAERHDTSQRVLVGNLSYGSQFQDLTLDVPQPQRFVNPLTGELKFYFEFWNIGPTTMIYWNRWIQVDSINWRIQ